MRQFQAQVAVNAAARAQIAVQAQAAKHLHRRTKASPPHLFRRICTVKYLPSELYFSESR